MLRILLTCAICGAAISAVAGQPPAEAAREWTDASGTRRARATLLRADGERLWLQRPDGKLTTTTLQNLSEPDRQYVASRRQQPAAGAVDSEPPTMTESVVEGVTDTVETLQQLPQWVAGGQSGEGSSLVPGSPKPAALVYLRISRDFLEDYVERSVRRIKPVRDCILGARITGESETRGRTRLALQPASGRLLGTILFDGTVRSRTTGRKGPVILHNVANSMFHAQKRVVMDDGGVRVGPATASVSTDLDLLGVGTTLPRLRGRIARRIGARRAAQSHGRAEAITADHTADDVREDFDQRVTRSMAKVQAALGSKIPELETGGGPVPTDVRFRSSPQYVEVAILRENATPAERKLRPPMPTADSDVAVRVHRSLFTTALQDPQFMQNLSPFFDKLLQARALEEREARTRAEAEAAAPKWNFDLEWLSLDFTDVDR
jgi:hypothetical protein